MSKYIKLDDMRAIFCQSNSLTQAWNGFDRLPSIDIVRCRECAKRMREDCPMCNGCKLDRVPTEDDDFCSYGEMKSDEQ